jgi:hypothetical protein
MTAAQFTYRDQQRPVNIGHSHCGSPFQCVMVVILGQGTVELGEFFVKVTSGHLDDFMSATEAKALEIAN